jgi:hypothetical protein
VVEHRVDHAAHIPLPIERDRLMLLMVAFNLGFTVFDIYLAHGMSSVQTIYMLIPLICLPIGFVPAVWIALTDTRRPLIIWAHLLGMVACGTIGAVGFAFHLRTVVLPGGEFVWGWVVFSAPVLAPLALSGIATLGIIAALEEPTRRHFLLPGFTVFTVGLTKRRLYFLFIAIGLSAATLSAAIEHAQGGYVNWTEWVPVVLGGACAGAALGYTTRRDPKRGEMVSVLLIGGMAVLLGILGFTFHASFDLGDSGTINVERLIHGAPLFAPMLFADLGLLVLIAAGRKSMPSAAGASVPADAL